MGEFKPGYVVVRYDKDAGNFRAVNHLTEIEYVIPDDVACFLNDLNGKRNPFDIGAKLGWNDKKTASVLLTLTEMCLVRECRLMHIEGGGILTSYMLTLWTPSWDKPSGILRNFSIIVMSLITVLCIPALIAGIVCCISDPVSDEVLTWWAIPLTALLSIALHEILGHLISGIALNAPVYEAGLLIQGAYVIIDETRLPNKWHRAQIMAAGIEVNMLIAGICFILASVVNDRDLWVMGLMNVCLVLSNLAPLDGLDGNGIASALLGIDLAKAANKVCNHPSSVSRLCRQESGVKIVAACFMIRLSQILLIAAGMAVMLLM